PFGLIGKLHNVRTSALEHAERNAGLTVHARVSAAILKGVYDGSHVAYEHGAISPARQCHGFNLTRRLELPRHAHKNICRPGFDFSARNVDVLVTDRRYDVCQTQVVVRQPGWIDLNAKFAGAAAA